MLSTAPPHMWPTFRSEEQGIVRSGGRSARPSPGGLACPPRDAACRVPPESGAYPADATATGEVQMNIRDELPRRVEVLDHQWITLSDGVRLNCRIWLPADAATDPVPAILEASPYRLTDGRAARLGDLPLLGGLRLRLRARRPARHRRFRRPDRRRVQRPGAARRLRGDRLACRAALVQPATWA